MPEDKKKRELAAIFSADVAGYSRLMADDEEATVNTIIPSKFHHYCRWGRYLKTNYCRVASKK